MKALKDYFQRKSANSWQGSPATLMEAVLPPSQIYGIQFITYFNLMEAASLIEYNLICGKKAKQDQAGSFTVN